LDVWQLPAGPGVRAARQRPGQLRPTPHPPLKPARTSRQQSSP
jgi:hypothetical protein